MKKLLALAFVAALTLTACSKKTDTAESNTMMAEPDSSAMMSTDSSAMAAPMDSTAAAMPMKSDSATMAK